MSQYCEIVWLRKPCEAMTGAEDFLSIDTFFRIFTNAKVCQQFNNFFESI